MDDNISPLTGLPELPDGYWWNVTRDLYKSPEPNMGEYNSYYGGGYVITAGFVRIMHNVEHTRRKYLRRVKVIEPAVLFSQLIQTPYTAGTQNLLDGRSIPITKHTFEITRDSVLRAANVLMGRWNLAKERELKNQAEESLLGDYPPKRLSCMRPEQSRRRL